MRSSRSRTITREGQLNLVGLMVTSGITMTCILWTHDMYGPVFFWCLILLCTGLILYGIIALVTRPLRQLYQFHEQEREVTVSVEDVGPARSREPLIVDKDYANLDVDAWADEVFAYCKKHVTWQDAGVTDEQLDAAEVKIGFRFPVAFRTLYKKMNGAYDLPNAFSIWDLGEIVSEGSIHAPEYIVFADGLVKCWYIGFQKSTGEVYTLTLTNAHIASSFMHGIDLIIADAPQIY